MMDSISILSISKMDVQAHSFLGLKFKIGVPYLMVQYHIFAVVPSVPYGTDNYFSSKIYNILA